MELTLKQLQKKMRDDAMAEAEEKFDRAVADLEERRQELIRAIQLALTILER